MKVFPEYYVKKFFDVIMDSGEVKKVMVYVMNDKHCVRKEPSINYLSTVLQGYADNNINPRYIYKALEIFK